MSALPAAWRLSSGSRCDAPLGRDAFRTGRRRRAVARPIRRGGKPDALRLCTRHAKCGVNLRAFYPFCSSFPRTCLGARASGCVDCSERPGGRGGLEAIGRIAIDQAPDLAISRQGHARLCRGAGDHGGQHGHRLSRLRARLHRRRVLRKSVSEADLARNIDRELISYRALARYYVVTGKEDDAKAALAAEASLKEAIDQSMKGTTNPARSTRSRGWRASSAPSPRFLPISSRSSARARWWRKTSCRAAATCCATSSTISPATPMMPSFRRSNSAPKRWSTQYPGGDGARQYVCHQFRPDGRQQRAGAPQVRREFDAARSPPTTTRSCRA